MEKDLQGDFPLFSVVVVALNPGEKWRETLESVFSQKYGGLEVIYKDGLSGDGSPEAVAHRYGQDSRLRLFRERDRGIYDAMNQALQQVRGDYIIFLNCGDTFFDDKVLERAAEAVSAEGSRTDSAPLVFYGDTYSESTKSVISSAPAITGFTCYRNIPCHQSCFYGAELFREGRAVQEENARREGSAVQEESARREGGAVQEENARREGRAVQEESARREKAAGREGCLRRGKRYDTELRVRADYDHFLWCYYRAGARMIKLDFTVASYEGGGYSESRENRARDREEHRLITQRYMSGWERLCYRAALILTLAPLRRRMAESRSFSGIYHRLKALIYGKKGEQA